VATKDEVAQYTVGACQKRGYSHDKTLAVLSALYQESGWDETIWDPTHTTYGVAQQDGSYPNRFNGYQAQVDAFLDRFDVQSSKPGASPDVWLNICWLQQAPNWPSAQYWVENGRTAYEDEIKSRIDTVTPYLDKYWPEGSTGETPVADSKRPPFNEFPIWSPNSESRAGVPPTVILLHTQQPALRPPPDNAAEALGNYCADPTPQVSYHMYFSQASDGGVTAVDGVDTDLSSWSVGNDNHGSINYCFAGSGIEWTRDEWMQYAGNAIDVAAWYAVQDIAKYPTIAAKVIGFGGNYPGSHADDSGVADHQWVTDIFGWGTHDDVGANFPGDYFTERFNYWLAGGESQAPPPVVVPPPPPVDPYAALTDRQLLEAIATKVGA
jgi:hypothetical protein